jgi:uncharacterized protein YecE (DUF72 family)
MEVRHDTWLENDSLNLMARFDMGFVISQSGDRFPYSEMVTAKNIYVRFMVRNNCMHLLTAMNN